MPRVAPAHVLAGVRPAAAPEAGQVAGDGDGAAGGGEEGELEGDFAAGQGWGGIDAVKHVGAGGGGGGGGGVVDTGGAVGEFEVGGQVAV